MKSKVVVDAGICGFPTVVRAGSEDNQMVLFSATSGCDKIKAVIKELDAIGALDAFEEINPASENAKLLALFRGTLKGCCSGCVVPVAFFKAMQVAAGLALPKDVTLAVSAEEA